MALRTNRVITLIPEDIYASAGDPISLDPIASPGNFLKEPPMNNAPTTLRGAFEQKAMAWLGTKQGQLVRRLLSVKPIGSAPGELIRLAVLLAVIYRESGFNSDATNKNAKGLGQHMKDTTKGISLWLTAQTGLERLYKMAATGYESIVNGTTNFFNLVALDNYNWNLVYSTWFKNGKFTPPAGKLDHPNVQYVIQHTEGKSDFYKAAFLYSMYHIEGQPVFNWLKSTAKTGTKLARVGTRYYDPLNHPGDYAKDASRAERLLPLIVHDLKTVAYGISR